MSYADIKKLKKVEEKVNKNFYKRHLIVGHDLFAWNLFKELRTQKGNEEVSLICTDSIEFKDLSPKGPTSLRGKENIELFKEVFSEIEIQEDQSTALFYKDMKFKPFGGRSKSEKLLWGEEFFTGPRASVDLKSVYPLLSDEEGFDTLKSSSFEMKPFKIYKKDPTDMISPVNWAVECTNGDIYECEHLYWGDSPQLFLNYYDQKNSLGDGFIEFCEGTRTPCVLFVKLIFAKPITDMKETLFLPLSYTHEWGHFIGEFSEDPSGESESKQAIEFIHYVDKNESSEEEISKKIRLLKRNLEKIFPESKKVSHTEYITFSEYSAGLKIDDKLFKENANELEKLTFFSYNGPLGDSAPILSRCEDSCRGVSFLARAMANYKSLQVKN